MQRPSWLLDIPAGEYHAATKRNEYLTSHRLMVFRRCPLEYQQRCTGVIVEKDTRNFIIGRATHSFILEGQDVFDKEFLVSDGPINEKTQRPYAPDTIRFREWAESQTKAIVSTADFELIKEMRRAVWTHPVAAELLKEGIAEGTVRTVIESEPCQARLDWFNPETGDLVDLKTCADVDTICGRFGDIRKFGYDFQLAFYKWNLEAAGYTKPVNCHIIAVEKKAPYRVAVIHFVELTIDDLNHYHCAGENFRDDTEAMLAEIKECRKEDRWPTRYENVITL